MNSKEYYYPVHQFSLVYQAQEIISPYDHLQFWTFLSKKTIPYEDGWFCNSIVAARLGVPPTLPGRAAQVGPRRQPRLGRARLGSPA